MILKINLLVVRDKHSDEVVFARPITDKNTLCCVNYTSDLLTLKELDEWLLEKFGDDWREETVPLGIHDRFSRLGKMFLHWRAGELPSIGRQSVTFEVVEVDVS